MEANSLHANPLVAPKISTTKGWRKARNLKPLNLIRDHCNFKQSKYFWNRIAIRCHVTEEKKQYTCDHINRRINDVATVCLMIWCRISQKKTKQIWIGSCEQISKASQPLHKTTTDLLLYPIHKGFIWYTPLGVRSCLMCIFVWLCERKYKLMIDQLVLGEYL